MRGGEGELASVHAEGESGADGQALLVPPPAHGDLTPPPPQGCCQLPLGLDFPDTPLQGTASSHGD